MTPCASTSQLGWRPRPCPHWLERSTDLRHRAYAPTIRFFPLSFKREPTDRRRFDASFEAIQVTDGIVYVERGRCGHFVPACLPYWMSVAGPSRVLRVILENPEPETGAIATLAHELRHALEVLEQPSIRTSAAMYFFYRTNRSQRGDAYETDAAVETGNTVLRELEREVKRRGPA